MEKSEIRTKRIIYLFAFVTAVLGILGSTVPQLNKLILALTYWYCFFSFPSKLRKFNDFDRKTKRILNAIVILTLGAIINSIFFDKDPHVGNKWITMFGNQECVFFMIVPCFAYLGANQESVVILKKSMQLFLIIGIFGLLAGKLFLVGILSFSPVFFPYVDRKYKWLLIASLGMAIYSSVFAEETSRTGILIIFFAIMSNIFGYCVKSRKVTSFFCYSMMALPFIYAIPTLMDPDYSIFQIVQDQIMQNTDVGGTSYDTNDTRSFLFKEISEDLSHNNAWLLGKGAYGHYFSNYFFNAENGDHFDRLTTEVTLLQLLLRGGVFFAIVYYLLIIYAVHNAIQKSQNKFLLSFAVLASGWIFISTISFLNGCSYRHLGFFLMVGCCLSPNMLNKTDEEIENMLRL